MTIPYGRQLVDEDDIESVVAVLRGDWLTQGPKVAEFESAVAGTCEVPFAVAFSSGTAALHAAAFAADLGPGDEAITSAITFAASANCAAYVGATPRFADIEMGTWNLSVDSVLASAGPNTKAVVPVHFAGLPAPVAELRAALDPAVRIIEDAAHALGAHDEHGPIGACHHSDMAVFSFHPVKAVTSGEGGIVATRNSDLRDRLLAFRNHGFTKVLASVRAQDGGWHQEQQALGFNYRLTDIQSALGRSQLRKLARFVEGRNRIADRYRAELNGLPGLELPPAAPRGTLHAYHLFVIHLGSAERRRFVYDSLRESGILAQVHYLPVYLHPWYRETYGYEPGLCPTAENYYHGCLSLPCFPALREDEQSVVIEALQDLLSP